MKQIFVDTGAWFARFVPSDRDHIAAREWFEQNSDPLVTTDYVIDELLTSRVRPEDGAPIRGEAKGQAMLRHFGR